MARKLEQQTVEERGAILRQRLAEKKAELGYVLPPFIPAIHSQMMAEALAPLRKFMLDYAALLEGADVVPGLTKAKFRKYAAELRLLPYALDARHRHIASTYAQAIARVTQDPAHMTPARLRADLYRILFVGERVQERLNEEWAGAGGEEVAKPAAAEFDTYAELVDHYEKMRKDKQAELNDYYASYGEPLDTEEIDEIIRYLREGGDE